MKELFEEEGQSIFTFKKGDIIIRLKNALRKSIQSNENLGIEMEVIEGISTSFRETPIEFIAIQNNLIYLRSMDKNSNGYIHKVRLEMYCDDWALFKIPDGLTLEDCI